MANVKKAATTTAATATRTESSKRRNTHTHTHNTSREREGKTVKKSEKLISQNVNGLTRARAMKRFC